MTGRPSAEIRTRRSIFDEKYFTGAPVEKPPFRSPVKNLHLIDVYSINTMVS